MLQIHDSACRLAIQSDVLHNQHSDAHTRTGWQQHHNVPCMEEAVVEVADVLPHVSVGPIRFPYIPARATVLLRHGLFPWRYELQLGKSHCIRECIQLYVKPSAALSDIQRQATSRVQGSGVLLLH